MAGVAVCWNDDEPLARVRSALALDGKVLADHVWPAKTSGYVPGRDRLDVGAHDGTSPRGVASFPMAISKNRRWQPHCGASLSLMWTERAVC